MQLCVTKFLKSPTYDPNNALNLSHRFLSLYVHKLPSQIAKIYTYFDSFRNTTKKAAV